MACHLVNGMRNGRLTLGSDIGIAYKAGLGLYLGQDQYGYMMLLAKNTQHWCKLWCNIYNGDIIGIAFDADAGSLTFYKNGTSQGEAFTGLSEFLCCSNN
jgi:hypothetical protein